MIPKAHRSLRVAVDRWFTDYAPIDISSREKGGLLGIEGRMTETEHDL